MLTIGAALVAVFMITRNDGDDDSAALGETFDTGPTDSSVKRDGQDIPYEYDRVPRASLTSEDILSAAFVVTEDVFNSELMAPYDILIIPSTGGSMNRDLENERYQSWLRQAVADAKYVITLCDGAFPLAETGALDGLMATTFPGDRDVFSERYPLIDVRYDARFVHDGKFITSVGGGMSYEPALYLTELLFGRDDAVETAEGLVWEWNVESVPHVVVNSDGASN